MKKNPGLGFSIAGGVAGAETVNISNLNEICFFLYKIFYFFNWHFYLF